MGRKAQIASSDKNSPFALRIVQTDKGVFFDLVDRGEQTRRLVITLTPQGTRTLAQWILDNIKVPQKGRH